MFLIPQLLELIPFSVLLAVIVRVTWKYIRTVVRFIYLASKIPGPTLWMLLTNHAKGLLSEEHLVLLWKMTASFGHQPWGLWTLGDYMVFVSDCESVSEIYKSKHCTEKADRFYSLMRRYVGKGLVTLDGPEYRKHRKVERPAFRKVFVESRFPQAHRQAAELIERLRGLSNGENVDVRSEIDDFSYAAAISTYSSDDISHVNRKEILEAVNATNELIKIGTKNTVYYWFLRRLKASVRQTESMIKTRKEQSKSFFIEQRRLAEVRMSKTDKEPSSIAECIVSRSSENSIYEFSDEDFSEGGMVLVSAAAETTAFALNVTLLLLALHPEVQQRVFEEMESVFGKSDRPAELEDLSKMEYLQLVIKESMRLFPPGPLLLRKATGEININGLIVPKGSIVGINILALHRNPKTFKDPLKFDPNRFLPEESDGRHPFAYIPFSHGLRDCPGQLQTYLVLKTALSLIVRNFQMLPGYGLESVDDIKITAATTTRLCESSLRLIRRKSK